MADGIQDIDELLTAKAVGKLLGVSPYTVYEWTRANVLPHIRIGPRCIRYRRSAILQCLASLERPATSRDREAA